MKRIVGENADQFITEVGHWLRNLLSLRCRISLQSVHLLPFDLFLNKSKEQVEVLQQDKVIMLKEIEKMKQDATEREEKMIQDAKEREERMRADFRAMMQEQLLAFSSGELSLHKGDSGKENSQLS